jgi:hypothetical protein
MKWGYVYRSRKINRKQEIKESDNNHNDFSWIHLLNPAHTLTSNFFKIHFSILPMYTWFSQMIYCLLVSLTNNAKIDYLCYTRRGRYPKLHMLTSHCDSMTIHNNVQHCCVAADLDTCTQVTSTGKHEHYFKYEWMYTTSADQWRYYEDCKTWSMILTATNSAGLRREVVRDLPTRHALRAHAIKTNEYKLTLRAS